MKTFNMSIEKHFNSSMLETKNYYTKCNLQNEVVKRVYCDSNLSVCVDPQFAGLQAAVYAFLSVFSLIFSSLLIVAVWRSSSSSPAMKTLAFNLSFSSSIVSIFVLPVSSYSVFYSVLSIPEIMCKGTPFILMINVIQSELTLAAISLDSYMTIFHPFQYVGTMTIFRSTVVAVSIWIVSVMSAIPPFFGWGMYCFQPKTMPTCGLLWNHSISYSIFLGMMILVIPLGVMMFSYFKISSLARSKLEPRHSDKKIFPKPNIEIRIQSPHGTHRRHKTRRRLCAYMRTLKIVIFNLGTVAVCWFPYLIFTVWHIAKEDVAVTYSLEFSVTCLKYMAIFVNPLVIIVLHRDYRLSLKRCASKLGCVSPKIDIETRSNSVLVPSTQSYYSNRDTSEGITVQVETEVVKQHHEYTTTRQ